MPIKPTIAIFDLDGTLTVGDTFLPYLRFQFGTWRWGSRIALLAPWIAGYKVGSVTAHTLKERFLTSFLAGAQVDKLKARHSEFLKQLTWRSDAIHKLHAHQARGERVILASASLDLYVIDLAAHLGIGDVICTWAEVTCGQLTGRLATPNCAGAEKRRRLQAEFGKVLASAAAVHAYGDSEDDFAMFALAQDVTWYGPEARRPAGSRRGIS